MVRVGGTGTNLELRFADGNFGREHINAEEEQNNAHDEAGDAERAEFLELMKVDAAAHHRKQDKIDLLGTGQPRQRGHRGNPGGGRGGTCRRGIMKSGS